MEIKRLILGPLHTNCYILNQNNHCIIIDPADEAEKIIKECESLKVEGILITHHHFDHIGALVDLEAYYGVKHNTFDTPNFSYEIIKTPGHKRDSLTFYFKDEKVMFTGDFLFYHTCGRYDLETSSREEMKESLDKIKEYPDDITFYPGHGRSGILGEEKVLFDTYV